MWTERNTIDNGKHSTEAIELVKEVIDMLKGIPDEGAECFPVEVIDRLEVEYGMWQNSPV